MATKMHQTFVTRWKGVKFIVALHLNDKVGWKSKNIKIQDGNRYLFNLKSIQ